MPRENFDRVWGSGGGTTDPDTAIPGKIATGFVGEKPPFQWQNWWQRRVDRMLQYFERHGIAEWDAGTAYEEDGICIGRDGHFYQAVVANTGNDPVTEVAAPSYESSNWSRLFPPATESRAGVIEIANLLETLTGGPNDKAVTPANLAQLIASTSTRGIVELATAPEVLLAGTGGAASGLAVTPSALEGLTATDARRGLVELATNIETQELSDAARAVTPQGLGSLFSVVTNVDGTAVHLPGGILVQFGRRGGGIGNNHTLNFPEDFADTDYSVVAMPTNSIAMEQDSRTVSSIDLSSGGSAIGGYDWIAIGTEA